MWTSLPAASLSFLEQNTKSWVIENTPHEVRIDRAERNAGRMAKRRAKRRTLDVRFTVASQVNEDFTQELDAMF